MQAESLRHLWLDLLHQMGFRGLLAAAPACYICFQMSLSRGEPGRSQRALALISGFMRAEREQSRDEPLDMTTLLGGGRGAAAALL